MGKKRTTLILLLYAILIAALPACGKTTTPVRPTSTQKPTQTEDPSISIIHTAVALVTLAPNERIATDIDDFLGIWETTFQVSNYAVIEFREDGTYSLAKNPQQLDTIPIVKGRYRFEGLHLFARDNKCKEGEYELRIIEEPGSLRRLNLIAIHEPCNTRGRDWRITMTEYRP